MSESSVLLSFFRVIKGASVSRAIFENGRLQMHSRDFGDFLRRFFPNEKYELGILRKISPASLRPKENP